MFFRTRIIKGRPYLYSEERYREGGKVRCRSRVVRGAYSKIPAEARKAADERYREVLRENIYRYGTSRSGARYAREEAAREAYHHFLDRANSGGPLTLDEARAEAYTRIFDRPTSAFESRASKYASSKPSPEYRARTRFENVKEAVRAENARMNKADKYPPKDTPTDEENAQQAERADAARDAADNASAEYSAEGAEGNEAQPG